MFDLEHAIGQWRRELLACGFNDPSLLDELEAHLRDDLERKIGGGIEPAMAFDDAVQEFGPAASLQTEFQKVAPCRDLHERFKHFVLTLAGIPQPALIVPMNSSSSNLDPGWAIYLKTGAFVFPALAIWTLSTVFLLPKLEQICALAGFSPRNPAWTLTHANFTTMMFFRDYGLWVLSAIVLAVVLLEWRSGWWPRYRRVFLGLGSFILNSVVLVSIFFMIVTALLAAPALLTPAK